MTLTELHHLHGNEARVCNMLVYSRQAPIPRGRKSQLLLCGFLVGLDLFVLFNFLASGKDSWILIKNVAVNVIPKTNLDHRHTLLNQQISKGGSAATDINSTIFLNDSFDKRPILGKCSLLEFLSQFLVLIWIFALLLSILKQRIRKCTVCLHHDTLE